MNAHDSILNPDSPWRLDVRRNAAARDQAVSAAADALGFSPTALLATGIQEALNRFAHQTGWLLDDRREAETAHDKALTDRLHAEREAKETPA